MIVKRDQKISFPGGTWKTLTLHWKETWLEVGLLALTRIGNSGFRGRGRDEKDNRLVGKRKQMMT